MKRLFRDLMKLFFIIVLPIIVNAQAKKIDITSDSYPISIEILRHRDPFHRESIRKLTLSKPISFSLNVEDIDTYILTQEGSSRFLVFIWDEDIKIYLKADSLDKSEILMSPLTIELNNYEILAEKKVFSHLRTIEKKIDIMYDEQKHKNIDSLAVIQKLQKQRTQMMNALSDNYSQFARDYLREYPKSFIGIYMLHFMEIIPTESDKKILKDMPEEYKVNYRYKELMERR